MHARKPDALWFDEGCFDADRLRSVAPVLAAQGRHPTTEERSRQARVILSTPRRAPALESAPAAVREVELTMDNVVQSIRDLIARSNRSAVA